MNLSEMIERQCDNMATGTQMRAFLRNEDDSEPELRELMRRNLEQFAGFICEAISEAVRADTVYVQWIGNQSLPVSDPFVAVSELSAALDRFFGHNNTSDSTTSSG